MSAESDHSHAQPGPPVSRDELADRYLDQLAYDPYPVQEEALLAWFSSEQGVLVCAPTGTGKTLIAEAALFEALHSGQVAYYTTPLIALTEQKFREMQANAVRWGFQASDVGLVTGNRRVNPDARILVVVAEILFNRLLHRDTFDFSDVGVVVMDEFHSFNDRERGIVWEFSLGLLPAHVRTLLLSATVGNSYDFVKWLRESHQRRLELVQSDERKVPLTFHWVPDKLLAQHMEAMADGDDEQRRTPALVFCFNRELCWTVAETFKGKKLLAKGQQDQLAVELGKHDWSLGAGPKLRQILLRGVGVHHAGVLSKYRRIVEDLFQRKLLSVAVCTETLSAGINLPARSVVLPTILKGPAGEKKPIDASTAHQIFGRAGRPQFDTQGFVYVLAHEDDVKILRWREEYDRIPDDTKDPNLLKAKKRLHKKKPKRRTTEQYWDEPQFRKLAAAPPGRLRSTGQLPWRLLAYMLQVSPDVEIIRNLVGKRLLEGKRLQRAQESLDRMLLTLWRAGYVTLEPEPKTTDEEQSKDNADAKSDGTAEHHRRPLLADFVNSGGETVSDASTDESSKAVPYRAEQAHATPELSKLLMIRGINPLYGVFMVGQLGIADRAERIQAIESVLDMPGTVARLVRVPNHDQLPPGPLATTRLDSHLLRLGLVTAEQLSEPDEEERYRRRGTFEEQRPYVLTLAEKLRIAFDFDFPNVHDVRTTAVWSAGELLEFGGDFNKYIVSKGLQKQEGVVFRHLLRMILLLIELGQICPPDIAEEEWQQDLNDIADAITNSCRQVDPTSTHEALEHARDKEEFETC
jgi:superfamily II DNA/RNA helicase